MKAFKGCGCKVYKYMLVFPGSFEKGDEATEHVKHTHHSRLKFLILFLPVELKKKMCNKCNEWIAIESFGQLHLLYFMNFSIFQFQRNSMALVHKPVCFFINIVREECKVMTKI